MNPDAQLALRAHLPWQKQQNRLCVCACVHCIIRNPNLFQNIWLAACPALPWWSQEQRQRLGSPGRSDAQAGGPAPAQRRSPETLKVKRILVFRSGWRQLRFALMEAKHRVAFGHTRVPGGLSHQSSAGRSFLAAVRTSGCQEAFGRSLLF